MAFLKDDKREDSLLKLALCEGRDGRKPHLFPYRLAAKNAPVTTKDYKEFILFLIPEAADFFRRTYRELLFFSRFLLRSPKQGEGFPSSIFGPKR